MNIQTIDGIVLASRTVNEADVISSIFTQEYGKADYMLKGLKKSRRRHLSASSPGSMITFSFYHNEHRRVMYVNDVSVRNTPLAAAQSYRQIVHGFYILEAVQRTSAEREAHRFVYRMLHSALLQRGLHEYPDHLSLFFTIHLLRSHGILPFGANGAAPLSVGGESFTLTDTMNRFIREGLGLKFRQIDCESYNTQEIQKLLFITVLYMEEYYNIEFKTKNVIFHIQEPQPSDAEPGPA